MRKLKVLLDICVIGTVLLTTGCTSAFEEAHDQYNINKVRSTQTLDNLKASLDAKKSLVSYSDTYYLGDKFSKIEAPKELPVVFMSNYTYSSSNETSLNSIIANISNNTGIHIVLSPDAVLYLTGQLTDKNSNSTGVTGVSAGDTTAGNTSTNTTSLIMPSSSVNNMNTPGNSTSINTFEELKNVKINLHSFKGSVKNLLDSIASQLNLFWTYDKTTKEVIFKRFETKIYKIDLSSFDVAVKSETSSKASDSSGGDDSASSITGNNTMSTSFDMKSTNAMNSFEKSLQNMMSPGASFQIFKSQGLVQVTDVPSVQREVDDLIQMQNQATTKKVYMKVNIFNVQLDKNSNYGSSIQGIFNSLGDKFNIGSVAPPSVFGDAGQAYQVINGSVGVGKWSISAVLEALNSLGHSTYVNGTTLATNSGVPNVFQQTEQQGYLKSTTISSVGGQGTDSTQVELNPGTIVTGFKLSLLPRILSNHQVNVFVSVNLSKLNKIDDISAGTQDQGVAGLLGASGGNNYKIQSPNVTTSTSTQDINVKNNQTIVIAGFTRYISRDQTASALPINTPVPLEGAVGAQYQKVTTVITITPTIVS